MAELEVSRWETALLRKVLSNLQRVVQDLRITIGLRDPNRDVRRVKKATSSITPLPRRNTRSKERSGPPSGPSESNSINTMEDTVMRPPLKGVSTPIPAVERNSVKKNKDIEAEISKQIIELVTKRKEIRLAIREGKERVFPSLSPSPLVGSRKGKIRIIENIQLAPPSNLDKQPAGSVSAPQTKEPVEAAWEVAENRKKKKKKSKINKATNDPQPRKAAVNRPKSGVEKSETVKLPKRRRPPRTAAVNKGNN